jgi:DNA-binding Lrp family transcriptional regulator
MDQLDRNIINQFQGGLPLCERPYAVMAERLGSDEATVLQHVDRLLEAGILSRFGPMFNVEKLGGAFCLAAMRIPQSEFDRVTDIVNAFSEVAHNYERQHAFNMWFVFASERQDRNSEVAKAIEAATGHRVYLFPKQEEFFVQLKLEVAPE